MGKPIGAMSSPWGESQHGFDAMRVPNGALPASEAREKEMKEKFDREVIIKVNEILEIETKKLQDKFKPVLFEQSELTKLVKYFSKQDDISLSNISQEKLTLELDGMKFSITKD